MKRLENKTALITGGNSGIGYAAAKEMLAQGAQVIITGRNQKSVGEAVTSLGNGAYGILSDAADMKDISLLADKVKAISSTLDVLFLNAGVFTVAPFELSTEEAFDNIHNVNNKGVFFIIQKMLPLIPSGGSIIINSTIGVHQTMPGISPLIAAKGAVHSLSKALANELAAKNIRVNTVSPGAINTPGAMKTAKMALGKDELDEATLQTFAQTIIPGIPMKRFGESHEVAKAVLFLASDDSSYVTGADLVIDGGKSIAW
jgi:NAD(P)-dependent dehydrogenase (short-subunit alcohol dehydrogenase family)